MARVVWTIEVFTVLVRGEDNAGVDTARVGFIREFGSVAKVVGRLTDAVTRITVVDSFKRSGERAELGFSGYYTEALERKVG